MRRNCELAYTYSGTTRSRSSGARPAQLGAAGSGSETCHRPARRNRRRQPVDASGMIDPDELDAIAEAVLAEEDEALSLPIAPGLVLELAYDGCGLFASTWRAGSWQRMVYPFG